MARARNADGKCVASARAKAPQEANELHIPYSWERWICKHGDGERTKAAKKNEKKSFRLASGKTLFATVLLWQSVAQSIYYHHLKDMPPPLPASHTKQKQKKSEKKNKERILQSTWGNARMPHRRIQPMNERTRATGLNFTLQFVCSMSSLNYTQEEMHCTATCMGGWAGEVINL